MDIASAAGTAETAVEAVMKVEPMIATGISMLVPGAAPIVATVQPFVVMAAPFLERALTSIAAKNGGDAFGALLDLLNHISPGRPNSAVLSASTQAAPMGSSGSASAQGGG
jgi:hypothetical protein